MAQTPMYNFEEDGVNEDINVLNNVHQQGGLEIDAIRKIVQPLKDGAWIGQGANAFFQSDEAFLKLFQALVDDVQRFSNTVKQASDATVDTVGQIDAVIAR